MLPHRRLIDLLFPKISLRGEEGEWVTKREWRELKGWPVAVGRSQLEVRGVESLDRLVAADTYARSPLLRTAVYRFKYNRLPGMAVPLGALLVQALPLLSVHTDPVLCPVPLHWIRRFHRGFNQSLLLARAISEVTGWPVQELLRRRHATGKQSLRERERRWSAVSTAFVCTAKKIPSSVILVDDVTTSGATLEFCARALRERGVEEVQGLVVAQG